MMNPLAAPFCTKGVIDDIDVCARSRRDVVFLQL